MSIHNEIHQYVAALELLEQDIADYLATDTAENRERMRQINLRQRLGEIARARVALTGRPS